MSKYFTPTFSTKRELETKWININIHFHDTICSCEFPLDHLKDILNRDQCRHFKDAATTTETGGHQEDAGLTIDEGDLENLFSEENDVTEG